MTQQNASLVEEAAAASEMMGAQAQELTASVAFFKTNDVAETSPVKRGTLEVGDHHQPGNGKGNGRGKGNGSSKPLPHAATLLQAQAQVLAMAEDNSDDAQWKEF